LEKYSITEMERFLRQLTASSNLLSVIGLCKNAGKTTILNAVLSSYLLEQSPPLWGLMSIGLDGETQDRATLGEKPEIFVAEGTIFVTPAHLWNQSDTSKEILDVLQSGGSLGALLLVRAKSDGSIQLSGPSTRTGIRVGIQKLETFGANKIIIDGSIDRRVMSMEDTSEVLLCTGNVCYVDHRQALQETLYIYSLYTQLPERKILVSQDAFLSFLHEGNEQVYYTADQIRRDGVDWPSEKSFPWDSIFYRGAVHSRFLRQIGTLKTKRSAMCLLVPDGSRILAPREHFDSFINEGNSIFVQKRLSIKGIFVNHQMQISQKNDDYQLMQEIANHVTCPVLDWKERLICTNPI
jgi:hypothetical protein